MQYDRAFQGEVLSRYKKVMVAELNLGQLDMLLRARFLVPTIGCTKVQGRPFTQTELEARIEEVLS